MKKVGLFYGAFNPLTPKAVSYAAAERKKRALDEIWFVIKEDRKDLKHRYALRKMAAYMRCMKVVCEAELNEKNCTFTDITDPSLDVTEPVYDDVKTLKKCQKRYIMRNNLYLESVSKSTLREKRWQHVQRVADLCRQFAIGNGYDEARAYCAGIYHDIAKQMDKEMQEMYMDVYYPQFKYYGAETWHQYVGAVVLSRILKCEDREVVKAVKHHCLGDDHSVLSMIVYCRDKLDPGRGYDSSKEIRLCTDNIKKGYQLVKKEQEEYLRKEGII